MTALLYAVFILSGIAGLIYESIWSRYLGLFVGHSAYAQIIVLAIFLGGMSLGALLVGRRSERLREPLLGYAAVELVVGVIGLAFHAIFLAVTRVTYDAILPPLAGTPALTIAKWAIAGALILPQSVLLGMTFPLMSAGALRRTAGRPGRTLSLLYFANSLGAAVGVLIAGFYLIRISGLPGTLLAAAVINIVVAAVTYFAVRIEQVRAESAGGSAARRLGGPANEMGEQVGYASGGPPPMTEVTPAPAELRDPIDATPITVAPGAAPPAAEPPSRRAAEPPPFGIAPERLWRLLLLVSFGTAVSSFIYEIAWIRMLSLVLGSATHSFELMLSAFIFGLAAGAFWMHGRADRLRDPVRTLGVVQWCMGIAALLTLPIYIQSFSWMVGLLRALDLTDAGYRAFTVTRYAFCLAVMLPATFCAGMTLPLITRTLLVGGHGERAVGTVYSVNTVGSIVGVILAGLVFLPLIGLKSLLIEGAVIDIALGLVLLRAAAAARRRVAGPAESGREGRREAARARTLLYAAAAVALVAVTAANFGASFRPEILSSGVYRYRRLPEKGTRGILFYKDGRTASVAAGRSYDKVYIATNGKPDASLDTGWFHPRGADTPLKPIGGDESTQALLPLVALAHHPHARTAAVIGQGSGMTSHLLLASPDLRELATIEIEPAMIEGSRRAFYPANRRVFEDPRAHFVIDDAKSYFAAARRRYDLIISEPSNPWVSGVSGLFTVEFYQRVRRYLTPDGIFGQWIHLYEIDDNLVLSVLAALHQNFPSYQIFQTSRGDILILASNRPALRAPDWSVFALPGVTADLSHSIPFTPAALESTRLFGRAELAPLLERWGRRNSDFRPVLDLGTERTRYLNAAATGFGRLIEDRFDLVAALTGRRTGFGTLGDNPAPQMARITALTTGAALRAPRGAVDSASLAKNADLAQAMQRWWRFRNVLASATPPADWRLWLRDAAEVERDLHGGTAGVADEPFYAALRAFAERHGAPQGVRDAIAFEHGLATYDFPAASRAADSLIASATEGTKWIGLDELRDGAVVAKLRTGDPAAARRAFSAVTELGARAPTDMRTMLLNAYVLQAEREASRSAQGREEEP